MKNETTTANEYDQQATDFLAKHGLKMRITLSDSKTPQWAKEGEETGHHYRVTISKGELPLIGGVNRPSPSRLVFDFWGSIADAKKAKEAESRLNHYNHEQDRVNAAALSGLGREMPDLPSMQEHIRAQYQREIADSTPSEYDVLACISGDAYTPETFADFCAEYGYESDSIKALQQFRRCDRFAKRLRAFFTESELQELSEIR